MSGALARWLAAAATVAGGVTNCACDDPCGGNAATDDPDAPIIENLELVRQLEGDPWTMVFALSFLDADGDAGQGEIDLYVGGSATPTTMGAADRFAESAVSTSATSGRIAIAPRFSETVPDGAEVRFSGQLRDRAKHRSNCYTLTMEFSVTPNAGGSP